MAQEATNPRTEVPRCNGCRLSIHERFVLKIQDDCWHSHCLACADCRQPLRDRCFMKHEQPFCKDDFYRRYATKCANCGGAIPATDLVRRTNQNVYHLDCFVCDVCGCRLNTGDQYYLMDSDRKLVCKADYQTMSIYAKLMRKNADAVTAEVDNGSRLSKRPRTTISIGQLDTLKRAYNDSAKPSRQVRERLSSETGLDMRVVQVWFQNRRAKEKRLKKDVVRPTYQYQQSRRNTEWNAGTVADRDQASVDSSSSQTSSDYFTRDGDRRLIQPETYQVDFQYRNSFQHFDSSAASFADQLRNEFSRSTVVTSSEQDKYGYTRPGCGTSLADALTHAAVAIDGSMYPAPAVTGGLFIEPSSMAGLHDEYCLNG